MAGAKKPRPLLVLVGAIVLTSGLSDGEGAGTTVYRCVTPNGDIELRQSRCPDGADEEELSVQDRRTGWIPPSDADEGAAVVGKRRNASIDDPARTRRDEQCWKKRQQLDDVNWKLRRGYAPSKGDVLRHKRRSYEDYIDRYCR
jgi:hypothetical protein